MFFNLLDRSLFIELSAEPQLLKYYVDSRKQFISRIVIDEIQLIPDLLYVVHQIMEETNAPQFCLTGSSPGKLKRSEADMLGGRAWNLRLHPFTHSELGQQFDLNRVLNLGSLPQIYLARDIGDAKHSLKSYIETYIEEEIRVEALIRDLRGFIKFLQISSTENGNPINFSNIARESFNKANDVKEFFQVLEDTLLGFFLLPYTKSTRKLTRHPKFYFFDTGVQRALSGKLSLDLRLGTKEYGLAFEHWLIKEIHDLNDYLEKDYRFSYYRTQHGAEVDLIIETPADEVFALEIKAEASISGKDLNGLRSFQEICPQAHLLCATPREDKPSYNYENITICNWREALKEIFKH
jgi:predicted AAA+ superfamily ATPase